jgi:hypothetical protein
MKTHIVIHLLPHELDDFEWQSKQFKIGSLYVNQNILIDATLNLNLIDWNNSSLPKNFIVDKFKRIEKLWDWCECKFNIDENKKCLGCNDARRNAIRATDADNILYLDSDLIFPENLLGMMTECSSLIDLDYYIISPQIVKLWDNTWDLLTNKNYIHNAPDLNRYYTSNPYEILTMDYGQSSLVPINNFKFGGGWFNLISTKLLKLTDIPDSLGSYGVDDSYVMICCNLLATKKYNVKQYVIENAVVTENYKYRLNFYKKYINYIDNKMTYRKTAEQNLVAEIEAFKNKI